ncbi:MAG: PAAR-like protein, partial [Fusobacteriota bacterium]
YDEWKKSDGYYVRKEEEKKIYSAKDSRIFYLYSEDKVNAEDNPKYPELRDWEFLCAYDHAKIREEAGNIVGKKDSGFQASAFKKGNEIIIAFRGSDDLLKMRHLKSDWIRTNLNLGFNNYAEQLICTAWFYNKVKEMEPKGRIHLTGHSLGGALAQFAFIYSGGKHKTKTWNGLGIGSKDKNILIFSDVEISVIYLKKVLEELEYIEGDSWTSQCRNPDIDRILEKYNDEYTVLGNNPKVMTNNMAKALSTEDLDLIKEELRYKLKLMYKFEMQYDRGEGNSNLENIYFSNDLTPNLQKRTGTIIEADHLVGLKEDEGGSGVFRKVATFGNSFARYHPIPNFLPFMDKHGNLRNGTLDTRYVGNAVKTLILSNEDLKEAAKNELKTGEKGIEYPTVLKENPGYGYGSKENLTIESDSSLIEFSIEDMLFSDLLKQNVDKYENNWYRFEGENVLIGRFTNYDVIGGVIGGPPFDEIKIEESGEGKTKKKVLEAGNMKKENNLENKENGEQDIYFGKAKIKLVGDYIGKNIQENSDGFYKDDKENIFWKDNRKKELHISYLDENQNRQLLQLGGFKEGNYGIWLEQTPPYHIEDGKIVGKYEKRSVEIGKVKGESENGFLDSEERIKDDFLWIMADEKIKLPEEPVEEKELEEEEEIKEESAAAGVKKKENKEKERESILVSGAKSASDITGSNLYVCMGAKMKCNFGNQQSTLNIVAPHNIMIDKKLMATMMDYKPMVNILPFGQCKSMANPTVAAATAANYGRLQPMPCMPNIVAPWVNAKMTTLVAGNPALLKKSKLTCAYAGMIKITDPGQDFVKA